MATIFDIAKKAGVSITTVSRALNGYSDVSAATRQRVMDIAEELNYYPSAAARSLQGKKTNTIAFASWLNEHVESEPFFKEFIGVLALACLKHDLSLLLTAADQPGHELDIFRELVGSGRVDGLILADVKPQDARIGFLKQLGVPFVAFGRTTDYAKLDYPFVDIDGAAGVAATVRHLARQGHQRIAYLSGPFDTSYALHRYQGYRQGMVESGLTQNADLIIDGLQEEAQAEHVLDKLLALPTEQQPTAIVANSDWLALFMLKALTRRNVSVGREPGQLALTGFDDLPFAAFLQPALTSVHQPVEAACNLMVDLLVAILKNQTHNSDTTYPNVITTSHSSTTWLGPEQALLSPELVVRQSA